MNEVKWKDEAVFYANGTQFREGCGGFQRYNDILESWQRTISGDELDKTLKSTDFQLNEIRTGDYIEASELDTEQKYNDAVGAFGLFGFKVINNIVNENNYSKSKFSVMLTSNLNMLLHVLPEHPDLKRKITYSQLMAIGKLK